MLLLFTLIYFSAAIAWALPPNLVPAKGIGGRVVNGAEAEEGQFPWQVAIITDTASGEQFFCSGTLIGEQWVLTSARCVDDATSATIYSGSRSLSSENIVKSQATEFILHEQYNDTYLMHNVALIKLQEPLVLNDRTKTIALAEVGPVLFTNVTLSGWGQLNDTYPEYYNDVLHYATMAVDSLQLCERYYGYFTIAPGLFCSVSETKPMQGPCIGDGGSPLTVIDINGNPLHFGLINYFNGVSCELAYPVANSRTSYYRDWIRKKAGI